MESTLVHYGVKGMRWGVRRYQNRDGTLTLAGKKRQAKEQYKSDRQANGRAYAKSISAVDAEYQKRMSAAKTDSARAKVERDWVDAVEKHDANWQSTKPKKQYVADAKKKHYDDVISRHYDKASATTKKVMDDYRSMTDQEFMNKYSVSKERYGKRVERNGDPYAKTKSNVATAKRAAKGATAVATVLQVAGSVYAIDMAYTGGAVTRAATKAGKAAVKSALSKVGDQMFDYSILDASGKVLRRYN